MRCSTPPPAPEPPEPAGSPRAAALRARIAEITPPGRTPWACSNRIERTAASASRATGSTSQAYQGNLTGRIPDGADCSTGVVPELPPPPKSVLLPPLTGPVPPPVEPPVSQQLEPPPVLEPPPPPPTGGGGGGGGCVVGFGGFGEWGGSGFGDWVGGGDGTACRQLTVTRVRPFVESYSLRVGVVLSSRLGILKLIW